VVAPPVPTLTGLSARDSEIVKNMVEYQGLSTEQAKWKGLREDKEKELEIAKTSLFDAEGSDLITVLEKPSPDPLAPVSSKRFLYFAIGMAIALMVAFLYPTARVLFNDTIIDQQDIEGLQLIPVLGVVPKIHVNAPLAPAPNANAGAGGGSAAQANRGNAGAV
jgi:hypothetical protein